LDKNGIEKNLAVLFFWRGGGNLRIWQRKGWREGQEKGGRVKQTRGVLEKER